MATKCSLGSHTSRVFLHPGHFVRMPPRPVLERAASIVTDDLNYNITTGGRRKKVSITGRSRRTPSALAGRRLTRNERSERRDGGMFLRATANERSEDAKRLPTRLIETAPSEAPRCPTGAPHSVANFAKSVTWCGEATSATDRGSKRRRRFVTAKDASRLSNDSGKFRVTECGLLPEAGRPRSFRSAR